MAGLSSAWLLSREGFRVTVFEKGPRAGFSAHSRDFSDFVPDGKRGLPGDVPSRMFNASLWPRVTQLYRDAGIEFEPVNNQQTFYNASGDVLLKVGLPYDVTSLLKQALNPVARELLQNVRRFQTLGRQALREGSADSQTFGAFLNSIDAVSTQADFLNLFLFPALTSTVFTCPTKDLLTYPCRIVLDALDKISSGQHDPLMRTVHGSNDAARRLLSGNSEFCCNTTVNRVTEQDNAALVYTDDRILDFDQVIVATQANHASQLVAIDDRLSSDCLAKFRYVDVPVAVHTDSSVMPARISDWGTFNFQSNSTGAATCSVWMNRFHANWPETTNFFHSIFPSDEIDPELVIANANLQRPVVDSDSESLHRQIDSIHSRKRRTWFAGSYAARGVPLLESAVQSSHTIVNLLKSQLPNASV